MDDYDYLLMERPYNELDWLVIDNTPLSVMLEVQGAVFTLVAFAPYALFPYPYQLAHSYLFDLKSQFF